MKSRLIHISLMLLAFASPALAAVEDGGEMSLLVKLFLGFFGLIVATQLIPGLVLLTSMLKGLFGKGDALVKPSEGSR